MTTNQPNSNPSDAGFPEYQVPSRLDVSPYLTPSSQDNDVVGWVEPENEEEGLNVSGLLHSLRRRWPLGVAVGITLATALAVALWVLVPLTYKADSLLQVTRVPISPMAEQQAEMTSADFEGFKETQAVLASSDPILQRALLDDNLDSLNLEVLNTRWRNDLSELEVLKSKIKIGYRGESDLLQIAISAEDPKEAANIVNAVTDAFLEETVRVDLESRSKNTELLRSSFSDINSEIRTKTALLLNMRDENGTSETAQRQQEMAQFEIDRLLLERIDLRQLITELDSEIKLLEITPVYEEQPTRNEILDHLDLNPSYSEAKLIQSAAQEYYDQIALQVPAGSVTLYQAAQEVSAAQDAVDQIYLELEPRIIERILRERGADNNTSSSSVKIAKMQVLILEERFAELNAKIEAAQEDAKKWGQTSVALEEAIEELEDLRRLQSEMRTQLELHDINRENLSRVSLIQHAREPKKSTIIIKITTIVFAWILVFSVTVGGFVGIDYLGKRVNQAQDITQNTSVRVIGSIPQLVGGGMFRFSGPPVELQLNQSIDSIRASLMFAKRDKPIEIVLVTSATGQEGKTTVASQLAMSLARSGRRTLLLDGDIRNPQQSNIFGLQEGPGLGELLKGEAQLDDILQPTAAENLWLAAAGQSDKASLKALSGEAFPRFVQEARSRFDFIVLDSSPVLTGADTLLLGQFADTTLLSVRRDISRTNKISAATERLRSVGIDIMGTVLNGNSEELRIYSTAIESIESEVPA